jgi:hypothetical protein
MTINNREHTRHNFAPFKWVKVRRPDDPPGEFSMYRLIDISKGGISFYVNAPTSFKRGHQFFVLEIEGKPLEKPLLCLVRFVKAADEFGVDFKVGSEFIKKKD